MPLFIVIIPALIFILSLSLYRHQGKRELLKLDLVHFLYAFVFSPLLFLWLKFVMYFSLQGDDKIPVLKEAFIYDSILSLSMLYVFAFIVIHTLTVSFSLKKKQDPTHDIFNHSEYFHIWVSHSVIYPGILLMAALSSFFNLFNPFTFLNNKMHLLALMGAGGLVGLVSYASISYFTISASVSHSIRSAARLSRFMRMVYILLVLSHLIAYFILTPSFSLNTGLYWFFTSTFAVLTFCSFFLNRSTRAKNMIYKMHTTRPKKNQPLKNRHV